MPEKNEKPANVSVKSGLVIALGTRAELIKMAPVIRALDRRGISYFFLHTGQHAVDDLLAPLGVKRPDEVLEWPESKRGRFGSATFKALLWNAKSTRRIGHVLRRVQPKVVACHGDTMSTAAIAAASRLYAPSALIAHVEAGLRSHDLAEPFPEELSRRFTDLASKVLFAPTETAGRNLRGVLYLGKKVFVTGNTNVDVLLENLPRSRKVKAVLPAKPFVFAQIHRQENIRSRERCTAFADLLCAIPAPVVFVMLENAGKQFKKFGLLEKIYAAKNVSVRPNLPYLQFLKIFSSAACAVTDSGGQTEEAAVLKIPTVIFRKRNERPEAEECGVAVRVGCDAKKGLHFVVEALTKQDFYAQAKASKNPFGDGKAGERIAKELINLLG